MDEKLGSEIANLFFRKVMPSSRNVARCPLELPIEIAIGVAVHMQ